MPKRTNPIDHRTNESSLDFLSDDELDGLKDVELDDVVGGKVILIPVLGAKPVKGKPKKA